MESIRHGIDKTWKLNFKTWKLNFKKWKLNLRCDSLAMFTSLAGRLGLAPTVRSFGVLEWTNAALASLSLPSLAPPPAVQGWAKRIILEHQSGVRSGKPEPDSNGWVGTSGWWFKLLATFGSL